MTSGQPKEAYWPRLRVCFLEGTDLVRPHTTVMITALPPRKGKRALGSRGRQPGELLSSYFLLDMVKLSHLVTLFLYITWWSWSSISSLVILKAAAENVCSEHDQGACMVSWCYPWAVVDKAAEWNWELSQEHPGSYLNQQIIHTLDKNGSCQQQGH